MNVRSVSSLFTWFDKRTIGKLLIVYLLAIHFCIPAVTAAIPDVAGNLTEVPQTPTTAPPYPYELTDPVTQPYIVSIDPIGLQEAGDTLTITGTTNLPGDPIIAVYITCIHSQTTKAMVLPCDFTSGEAIIAEEQSDGFRRWYFVANTTDFAPDHYLVEAGQTSGHADGISAYDDANFFLISSQTARTIEQLPVRIDPIPSHAVNNRIQFQGTVTNYPGEDFIITVAPGQFLPGGTWQSRTGTVNGSISGHVYVLTGSNGTNPWTFSFDTRGLDSGDYSIEIKSAAGECVGYGFFSLRKSVSQYAIRTISPTPPENPQPLASVADDTITMETTPAPVAATPQNAMIPAVLVFMALGFISIFVLIQQRRK